MPKTQKIKIEPHKQRSWIIPSAHMRLGGPMRDKRSKRAEENKNPDYMEDYVEKDFDQKLENLKTSVTFSLGRWTGTGGWEGRNWFPNTTAIRIGIPDDPADGYKWYIFEPANPVSVGSGKSVFLAEARSDSEQALISFIEKRNDK